MAADGRTHCPYLPWKVLPWFSKWYAAFLQVTTRYAVLWAPRVTDRFDELSARRETSGGLSTLQALGCVTPFDEAPEWRTWCVWSWLQYKFIVDGEWRHDEQQAHMADSHGHVNNWLLITRQHHHILPPAPDMGTTGITMDVDQEMVHQVVSTHNYNDHMLIFLLFIFLLVVVHLISCN